MQLALYKGRTRLFDRAVQWWTRSIYSHCELVFSTDSHGVSTCGSSSYLDGGVRIKNMALDPAKWDLVDLPGFDPVAASKWFDVHAGQRYDLIGLFGFVLPFVRDNSLLPIPDVAAWTAFYGAMVAAGNANFGKAQQLKAALEAANTVAEVAAVVW